jgi:hypothetical protein
MKTSYIVIIAVCVILLVSAVIFWKKKKADLPGPKKEITVPEDVLATDSVTTVVDTGSGQEFIVSNVGNNPIDYGTGTQDLNNNINHVVQTIAAREGQMPTQLTLKTYTPSGVLMGSTSFKTL